VERAGDGTTTAVVLAQAIINHAFKNITSGANPMQISTGMEKAYQAIVAELKKMSKPVKNKDEIQKVAMVSANNDQEIGEIIANVMDKVVVRGLLLWRKGKPLG
jgi:chaperonin GroEL